MKNFTKRSVLTLSLMIFFQAQASWISRTDMIHLRSDEEKKFIKREICPEIPEKYLADSKDYTVLCSDDDRRNFTAPVGRYANARMEWVADKIDQDLASQNDAIRSTKDDVRFWHNLSGASWFAALKSDEPFVVAVTKADKLSHLDKYHQKFIQAQNIKDEIKGIKVKIACWNPSRSGSSQKYEKVITDIESYLQNEQKLAEARQQRSRWKTQTLVIYGAVAAIGLTGAYYLGKSQK